MSIAFLTQHTSLRIMLYDSPEGHSKIYLAHTAQRDLYSRFCPVEMSSNHFKLIYGDNSCSTWLYFKTFNMLSMVYI